MTAAADHTRFFFARASLHAFPPHLEFGERGPNDVLTEFSAQVERALTIFSAPLRGAGINPLAEFAALQVQLLALLGEMHTGLPERRHPIGRDRSCLAWQYAHSHWEPVSAITDALTAWSRIDALPKRSAFAVLSCSDAPTIDTLFRDAIGKSILDSFVTTEKLHTKALTALNVWPDVSSLLLDAFPAHALAVPAGRGLDHLMPHADSRRSPAFDSTASNDASRALRDFILLQPSLTSGQIAEASPTDPGQNRNQRASRWRRERRLLGIWNGHEFLHPTWQFRHGRPDPRVAELLAVLPADNDRNGWERALWLYTGNAALEDRVPEAVWPSDPDAVIAAARREYGQRSARSGDAPGALHAGG
jgi:hypothetical protein